MFGDDNFGEWCATQNKQVNCTFAAVAASRVLPNISGGHAVDVRNATKGLIFDISIIRAILTVAVCGAKEIATLATAAKSASSFTLKYVQQTDTGNFAHSAAVMAASLVLEERDFSTAQVLRLASQSMSKTTQNSALAAGLIAANYDANALTAEFLSLYKVETIWKRGLWLDAGIPTQVQSNWFNLKRKWSSHLAMTFWIDWYEGLLVGSAPDWDLWHDIVLIDDEHWQAGPEAVAREIEILQAARDVDENIERFEAQLLQLASEPIFRGNRDNGGPPIEDHQARLATIQLIQAQLDVLKAEAEKAKPNSEEDPDPEVILTAIEKLKELVKKHFIIATVATTIGTTCVVNIVDSGFERYHVSEAFYETFEAIPSAATKLLEKLAQRPSSKPTTSKPRVDSTPIDI
jgi:hypothetical protein